MSDFFLVAEESLGVSVALPNEYIVEFVEGNILRIAAGAMMVSHNSHFKWAIAVGVQPDLLKAAG
jgi:hypothetical protein